MRKQLVSTTQMHMAQLLREALDQQGISQAELARQAGLSLKHVNQVLNGAAGAQQGQLDYWAWLLGLRFEVTLVSRDD
jgi:gp16 family phage-associated protein